MTPFRNALRNTHCSLFQHDLQPGDAFSILGSSSEKVVEPNVAVKIDYMRSRARLSDHRASSAFRETSISRKWNEDMRLGNFLIWLVGRAAPLLPIALAFYVLSCSVFVTSSRADTGSHGTSCTSLAGQTLNPGEGIIALTTTAELLAIRGRPVCVVKGLVQPQIQFELRLPVKGWNGRYFQTGCGGFCGQVRIEACDDQLAEDFAVAAENMGHVGNPMSDPIWGADPALRIDFASRSTHAVSIVAKTIVANFYGRPASRAYFRGCSTGGREGLSEAQRYPTDFDGIIAGDPAFSGRLGGIANIWDAQHLFRSNGTHVFTDNSLMTLHAAVLKACDALDGLVDGILSDPRRCRFNLQSVACPSLGSDHCLTPEQVSAAAALYDGPRNRSGRRLIPGYSVYGSEVAWNQPAVLGFAAGGARYLDFASPPPDSFTYRDFNFNTDIVKIEKQAALYDPVAPYHAPDLDAFRRRGGKLIVYQGWADPGVSPLMILDYYAQVTHAAKLGAKTADWFRVFMVPGMLHCRGGDAPNNFDMMKPLIAWVEAAVPPDRIVAIQQQASHTLRSRPLVPYPNEARYIGKGDPDDAANWIAVAPPAPADDRIDWIWKPRRRQR